MTPDSFEVTDAMATTAPDGITSLGGVIPPAATTFHVNLTVGCCSCAVGTGGAPCRHQYAVVRRFDVTGLHWTPMGDTGTRRGLHEVATGRPNAPDDWFEACAEVTQKVILEKEHLSMSFIRDTCKMQCYEVRRRNEE